MKYQVELRQVAITFIQEKLQEDKHMKFQKNLSILEDTKLLKMRTELMHKLEQLDEFKKTIEDSEWQNMQMNDSGQEKISIHEDFMQKIQEENVFKQLLYAAEKKMEQEERKRQRDEALKNKHNKLLDEQIALEEELNMLQQMYE
jgi:hypothetical protein